MTTTGLRLATAPGAGLVVASVSFDDRPDAPGVDRTLDRVERAATLPRGPAHAWGWVCLQHAIGSLCDVDPATVRLRPRIGATPCVELAGRVPLVSISHHGRRAVAAAWWGDTLPAGAALSAVLECVS